MKRSTVTTVCLILAGLSFAGEMHHASKAASKEFQRMTELVGKWKGSGTMDGKPEELAVEYRLTAGGSVVMETLFPGTPREMVTLYHDSKGKLSVDHYCAMGNQPHMRLVKADDKGMDFDFAPEASDIDAAHEAHMHSLSLTFADKDHLKHKWTQFEEGKPKEISIFEFARVKQ